MKSHLIEVLLQGLWSSLTGGWFYDPHLSIFINTVHMYTWLFLFLLPFFFYFTFSSNLLTWSIYIFIIFISFTIIKLINYQLNRMYDKNRILCNEKMIKVPKIKLKSSSNSLLNRKKRLQKTSKKPRSILTHRPVNHQHHHHTTNSTNQIRTDSISQQQDRLGLQATNSLTASRADSLVTSLKTMDLINDTNLVNNNNNINNNNQQDTESNLNVFMTNECNNSNLDASISNKSSRKLSINNTNNQKQLEDLSLSKKSLNNVQKQSSLSSSSNLSNDIDQLDSNYEQIKKIDETLTLTNDLCSSLNDDQNLKQKDLEDNSNRSLFKISEESLHNHHINNLLLKPNQNGSFLNSNKQKSQSFKINDKKKFIVTKVASATTVPNLETSQSTSVWFNTNSFTELDFKTKLNSIQKQPIIIDGYKSRSCLIRRTKSDLSFNLFEKIYRKTELNFINNKNSFLNNNDYQDLENIQQQLEQDTNPNSIYESIDGESSKTLINQNRLSKNINNQIKQSKTSNDIFLEYKNESENLEKKISFLKTTQSLNKSITSPKRLGAKSFHNLSSIKQDRQDEYPNLLSLSQYIQYEDLKQFKSNLINTNNFSLESIKKKFLNNYFNTNSIKQNKLENEYHSITLSLDNDKSDIELKKEYEKQDQLTMKRSYSLKRESGMILNSSNNKTNRSLNDRSRNENTSQQRKHRNRSRSTNKNTQQTNHFELIDFDSNLTSPPPPPPHVSFQTRNLTLSATQAANAAAKIIKRDLIGRLKSSRNSYRVDDGNIGDEEDEDDVNDGDIDDENDDEDEISFSTSKKTIRFDRNTNDNLKEYQIRSKNRRRSSKFRQRNDPSEFGLMDDLNRKDSKLTPQITLRSNDYSNESDDNPDMSSQTYTRRALRSNISRIEKSSRNPYETFMDIINMNEEGLYENDDQLSDVDNFNIPRSSRTQHSNHYRYPKKSSNNRINTHEFIPMNTDTSLNFLRSRSEPYSSSTRRQLIRSRLRFSNRRSQAVRTRTSNETRSSVNRMESIDINAYHVIIPSNDNEQTDNKSTSNDNDDDDQEEEEEEIKKKYYKLPITKSISLQIPFDHYSLLAMLDKNQNVFELVVSVLLAILVSLFSSLIFAEKIYDDLYLILFCFIIASCHYSLLKSVQPDSSSPIHGFNRLTALGRPIYFCIICFLILSLKYLLNKSDSMYIFEYIEQFKIYNLNLAKSNFEFILNSMEIVLLFLPIFFTLGLFPQITTFTLTILEQIDMNLFGGTSMTSLPGAFLCLFRSIISILFLTGILYSSIFTIPGLTFESNTNISTQSANNNQFSQTVLFSLYCALVIVVSYSLSRQTSDLVTYFDILKDFIFKRKNKSLKKKCEQKSGDYVSVPGSVLSSPISNSVNNTDDKLTALIGEKLDENETFCLLNEDPFELNHKNMIKIRLESDLITNFLLFILVFALHVSTLFTVLKPWLTDILFITAVLIGLFNHYILPHLRVENPWFLFSQPLLKPKHWSVFEPNYLARLEWFEIVHLCFNFAEKNFINIMLILSSITSSSDQIMLKYKSIDSTGLLSCFLITLVSLKLTRNSFCEPSKQFKIFLITYLFHKFDSKYLGLNETILFDLYFISLALNKLEEFLNKIEFIYVYTAPWQLPWGSAFHAFAQPLFVPHTSLLFLQAFISSLIGAPLMPLMGSAIFLLSYMRPIKFWEKSYKTKRIDNSNTRLQSQFDMATPDSENLNSIFYEHLSSVLQKSLCGDLMLGRWGNVTCGDFFILSSDYLNCLVHIIETGNGFVTFQLRGLEFKGTYCQQRELEAITEDINENEGFCCCNLGHLKYMLSFNASFHLRWVAWSVITKKYIVDAYRIVDNDLSLIVNFYSLRRTLVEFYIKSAIFYSIKSPKLFEWISNSNILKELNKYGNDYVDYDTCFDSNLDMDYDTQIKGVTLSKFNTIYFKWINHCRMQRMNELKDLNNNNNNNNYNNKKFNLNIIQDDSPYSLIVRFCFALSLVCRRALITACTGLSNPSHLSNHIRASSYGGPGTSVNLNTSLNSMGGFIGLGCGMHSTHTDSDSLSSFQHGYYTLFKGDIRIQSSKDEWVFNDMDILNKICLPAVRMGLRLHQDHFQNDSNDEVSIYDNLKKFDKESVICYERDPVWRKSVLSNVSNLLSLRHQYTEYSDQYKVVMLNKNFLSFRIIKINKECVRSFWSGQQHELIYLRNKNQERGSIQNAKQVLRNIINSSCDQPIGYPIYVSPLITSYSSTHDQIKKVIGPEISFKSIFKVMQSCFRRIRDNCTNDCSGSANENVYQSQNLNIGFNVRNDQINLQYLSPNLVKQDQLTMQETCLTNETTTITTITPTKKNYSKSGLTVQKESNEINLNLRRPKSINSTSSKVLNNENCEEKV